MKASYEVLYKNLLGQTKVETHSSYAKALGSAMAMRGTRLVLGTFETQYSSITGVICDIDGNNTKHLGDMKLVELALIHERSRV